jgi:hypothetical protein
MVSCRSRARLHLFQETAIMNALEPGCELRTGAAILSGVLRDGKPKGNEMSDETLSWQSNNPGGLLVVC